jgi:pseudouridine 5'-phosphatase
MLIVLSIVALMVHFIQNDPKHLSSILSPSTSPHYHVLFDCDGLILDTEPIYSAVAVTSIRHLLRQHNKPIQNEKDNILFPLNVKFKVMGGTSDQVSQKMANYISSTHNIPVTADEWSSLTAPLESHHFSLGCPLMPFIPETINLFKQKGWPIALATSSARHTFLIKSKPHADLFSNFHVITCGDDPDYSPDLNSIDRPKVKGKPHPSIFRTARYHLNRSPSNPGLVLEDSPNGVVAALRSGHSCIWVPTEDALPGFQLIQDLLKEFESEIQSELWVYRAESLKELFQ